jgi:hypothetical protein
MRALLAGLLLATGSAYAAEAQPLQPRDINLDGVVDAFYDPAQGLTFAADANLAGTMGLYTAPSDPGAVEWWVANRWAQALDLYGVTGWRLPRVTEYRYDYDVDGNLHQVTPIASELLGLPALAPFTNVQAIYWHEEPVPIGGWNEGFIPYYASDRLGFTKEANGLLYAWAVRDGDVQPQQALARVAAIPEPSTWLLLVLGGAAVLLRNFARRA